MSYLVFDISAWQHSPDFTAYRRAGAHGVIHKVGGSDNGRYLDSRYAGNAPRIRAAGLALGHYWFNGTGDPVADADFFCDHLVSYRKGDFVALDVEGESGVAGTPWSPSKAMKWLRRVEARLGVKPYVYMSASVTHGSGWAAVAKAGYPLWVASYGGLYPIAAWDGYSGWQYTDKFSTAIPVDASHFLHPLGSPLVVAPAEAEPATPETPDWSNIMFGFVRKTSNGEVSIVDPASGKKRPLHLPEWLSYQANGAKFAELADTQYDSIPNV